MKDVGMNNYIQLFVLGTLLLTKCHSFPSYRWWSPSWCRSEYSSCV